MTRMTGPDCVVRCNLINTHTHTLMSTEFPRQPHGACYSKMQYCTSRALSGTIVKIQDIPRGVE